MSNNEYPLEQLVLIKQKNLEEAEKILAEKKALLAKEVEKLRGLEKERDKVKEHKDNKLKQLRDELDAGSTSDKIQQMKQYLKVVQEQLKQRETKVAEQLKVVDAAEKQLEIARQNRIKKEQEVEKMSIHRSEWEKEQNVIEERKQAGEMDEMGTAMHILRKKEQKAKGHQKRKKHG